MSLRVRQRSETRTAAHHGWRMTAIIPIVSPLTMLPSTVLRVRTMAVQPEDFRTSV